MDLCKKELSKKWWSSITQINELNSGSELAVDTGHFYSLNVCWASQMKGFYSMLTLFHFYLMLHVQLVHLHVLVSFLFDEWVTKTQSTYIPGKLGQSLSEAKTLHRTGAEMKADALLRKFLTTTVDFYITKHQPPGATSGWKESVWARGEEWGSLLLCLHNLRHQSQACDCCVIVLISSDDTNLAVFSASK